MDNKARSTASAIGEGRMKESFTRRKRKNKKNKQLINIATPYSKRKPKMAIRPENKEVYGKPYKNTVPAQSRKSEGWTMNPYEFASRFGTKNKKKK